MTEGSASAGNDAGSVSDAGTAGTPDPIVTNPNPASAADPTPDPAPAGDPWHQSYDDETKGWLQNRGLDKMSAQDAQTSIIKSFRNAEAKLGVPSDRRLTLPMDPTAEGAMNEVYNQLGRPADAAAYEFNEDADGSDKAYTDWAKATFHGLGLSQKQGAALYEGFTEFVQNFNTENDKQTGLNNEAANADLKREWGGTYEHNMAIAKAAVGKLDVPQDVLEKVEGLLGYAPIVKLFHKMGELTGEDVYIGSTNVTAGGGMPTTPQAAKDEIRSLKADSAFTKRWIAGDTEAKKMWTNLHKIAAQGG